VIKNQQRHLFHICLLGCLSLGLTNCASTESSADPIAASSPAQPEAQISPAALAGSPPANPQLTTINPGAVVTYQPTTADFLNPERGFHQDIDLMGDQDMGKVRRKGYSIARTYVRLDKYRNQPLPAAVVSQLDRQLQLVRAAGIKVVLRFSYNHSEKDPDTSFNVVSQHITQLKPLLQKNADVIAVLQAGFIGAWGEWHHSHYQLDEPEAKTKVLNQLLAAMPPSRMVQIRYPSDIQSNYPQLLTAQSAFRGTRQARVGFHNDCFLVDRTDAGTFYPKTAELRTYIGKVSPYMVVGGETCQIESPENRADCPSAEADLAQFHWSYLNADYHEPTLDRWRNSGCYQTISRKLGYRFQLSRSSFPTQIKPGGKLIGNFVVKNVGYASPFNPRGLELILRHQQTGQKYRIPILKALSKTQDPRFWLPKAGEISVAVTGKIAANAPRGGYDLLLNLPDPMPKLANRAEYSIRLANEQLWESKTGFNSLKRTIQVKK
jgi:hypothetical protein